MQEEDHRRLAARPLIHAQSQQQQQQQQQPNAQQRHYHSRLSLERHQRIVLLGDNGGSQPQRASHALALAQSGKLLDHNNGPQLTDHSGAGGGHKWSTQCALPVAHHVDAGARVLVVRVVVSVIDLVLVLVLVLLVHVQQHGQLSVLLSIQRVTQGKRILHK